MSVHSIEVAGVRWNLEHGTGRVYRLEKDGKGSYIEKDAHPEIAQHIRHLVEKSEAGEHLTPIHPAARLCEICWRVKPAADWEHCFLCGGLGSYPDYDAIAAEFKDTPTRKCGECWGEGHKAPKEKQK